MSAKKRRQKNPDLDRDQNHIIPEDEAWLYRNEQALEQVRQGLADAAAGRVTEAKSFAEYADKEID